jgi:hypothetical protein
MEDAVTRQHAQYLVAATLTVSGRVLGELLRHQRSRANTVELLAPAAPHAARTAQALQEAARRATRAALREAPTTVFVEPIEGGYRLRVLLAAHRPPLQPHEVTDIQVAWQRARERVLGPACVAPVTVREVEHRAHDVERALANLRAVQSRVMHGHPEQQVDLADALNRAQMATDALREAQRRAAPMSPSRPRHADLLSFAVRTEGLDGLTLVERDAALRAVLARAAGLADPSELRVTTRPLRAPGQALVRVAFNLRDTPTRGPGCIDPASLRDTILTWATRVPPTPVRVGAAPVRAGAALVRVSVRAIEWLGGAPDRGAVPAAARELPVPAVVRDAVLPVSRVRN